MPTNYTPSQVYDKYVALQKQLATNITSKGVTASQTELYDNLIDKVAQIENLKGEERTLENFTNVLSEPKSIVQLEYPEPKNLFNKNNANIIIGYPSAENVIEPASTTKSIYIPCAPNTTYTVSKVVTARFAVAFTDVLPASGVAVTGRVQNNTATSITATSGANSKYIVVWMYHSIYDTTTTVDEILATLQIELGSTATPYEPYPAPKTLNAKLGSKNLFDETILLSKDHTEDDEAYIFENGKIGSTNLLPNTTFKYKTQYTLQYTAKQENPASSTTRGYPRFVVIYTDGTKSVKQITTEYTTITITSTSGKTVSAIKFEYGNVGKFYLKKDSLSLVEGTVALSPYTPYVSDFSTVSVTRCGKNLFDKSIPISSYIRLNNSYKYLKYYVGTGANVTVSIAEKPTVPNDNGFMYVYPSATPKADANAKWLAHQTVISLCSQQQTVVSTDGYMCLVVSVKRALDYYGNSIQIELGTTATEYEPYQGQTYTPTATGEVTGITNLYPTTTLLTDNAGVIFEQVTGGSYKEILPSTDKNGITKVYQPSVDSTIDSNITSDNIKQGVNILGVTGDYICNYTYDETTKELVLIL